MEQFLNYIWTLPLAWILFKIKQYDSQDLVTREEVEKMIADKTDHLQQDVHEMKGKIDVMNDQLVAIGVTLARIDERMKRDV